jgi:hypothetical protein
MSSRPSIALAQAMQSSVLRRRSTTASKTDSASEGVTSQPMSIRGTRYGSCVSHPFGCRWAVSGYLRLVATTSLRTTAASSLRGCVLSVFRWATGVVPLRYFYASRALATSIPQGRSSAGRWLKSSARERGGGDTAQGRSRSGLQLGLDYALRWWVCRSATQSGQMPWVTVEPSSRRNLATSSFRSHRPPTS